MNKPPRWHQTTVKEWQKRAFYLDAHGQRQDAPIAIRSSSSSSSFLKRNIGTQPTACENLKESSTGARHVEVEEPSMQYENSAPEPPKQKRKRKPELTVCQEFKDVLGEMVIIIKKREASEY